MNVVHYWLQPVRETCRMNQQLAGLLITTSEVAIINVDVVMKMEKDEYLKKITDEADLTLIDGKPLLWIHTPCTQHGQCHDYGIPYHFMLHSSYPCLFHLYHQLGFFKSRCLDRQGYFPLLVLGLNDGKCLATEGCWL